MKSNLRKILTGALIAGSLLARDADAGSWAKVSSYHDSRDYSTITLTGGASDLPFGTGMFGFIESNAEKTNRDNLREPYGEVSLSKKSKNDLGVIVEYNRNFEFDHGVTRLGLLYEPDLPFFLGAKFHPLSTRNNGVQIVVYGNKRFNDGNEYVEGFVDYNFKPEIFVGEVQVGKRINGKLFGVVEGRHNGFREDKYGVGLGLEWKL